MQKTHMWSRLKLGHKLILCTYAVLFPILIVCSAVLYHIDARNTMRENTRLYERFTQNACNEIAYLQTDMLDIATYFAVNDSIANLLERPAQPRPESSLIWYEETPVAFLQNVLAIKSHIKTLILYPENGYIPFYISRDASVHNLQLDNIRGTEYYRAAVAARGDILWSRMRKSDGGTVFTQNTSDKIVAYRELFDLSKANRLGFLTIGMDVGEYVRICQNALQVPNEGIVVLAGEGQEFVRIGACSDAALACIAAAATHTRLASQGSFCLDVDSDYVFGCASEKSGVQVYYVSPKANWTNHEALVLPLVLAAALLLLASVPLTMLISRTTLRDTRRLCDGMVKFRGGDFSQQLPVTSSDEIGELSSAFNAMVCDIKDLIEQRYVLQLRERESELNALQAQINPHFLYNVLDSLYWQAETAENEELAENILTLSRLFRLLLNQGSSESTVKQEQELIQCYLQIQKMRFASHLHYSITIDPALQSCPLPKLTLQPIVENAVVHGVEGQAEGGTITIVGTAQGDTMHFTITDDGVGMEQAAADALLLDSAAASGAGSAAIGHYAIRNIKQRLELEYAGHYTFAIYSAQGRGTRVELGLPRSKTKGGNSAK